MLCLSLSQACSRPQNKDPHITNTSILLCYCTTSLHLTVASVLITVKVTKEADLWHELIHVAHDFHAHRAHFRHPDFRFLGQERNGTRNMRVALGSPFDSDH